MRKYELAVLGSILCIAAFLRLYHFTTNPVSLYWDEVSLGYNAFSIAETLRDEHGHFMPILFEAFGDYKMPAYIYLTAIFVKMFGLSEFSVRIGSAVLGIGTVFLTYSLTRELLKNIKLDTHFKDKRNAISLLASFFMAISPWHIQFSRTGYEANAGLFFVLLGAIFFLLAIRKSSKYFFITSMSWGVSIYFYRSILGFMPFLVLIFLIVYYKEILSRLRHVSVYLAAALFIAMAVPIYYAVFFSAGSVRASEVSVVSNSKEKVLNFQNLAIRSGHGYLGNIFYNKRIVYFNEIANNYLSHFSPSFLFVSGDPNPRHSPRNMGVMYLFELPLVIYGLFMIARTQGKSKKIIFLWILIAPIPAAISLYSPHALRSLNMLPLPYIVTAIGAVVAFYAIKKFWRIYAVGTFSAVALFFVATYIFNYFTTSTFLAASEWGDGQKQLNVYLADNEQKYDMIIISGQYWQPYAYSLFYTQYDPREYQKSGNPYHFGKYYFGGTSWVKNGVEGLGNVNFREMAKGRKALVALSPDEYAAQSQPPGILTEIRDSNNTIIYYVGEM